MNKILAEHFMDPAEVVGGEEVKPRLDVKPHPTGTTVGKMEQISGAGAGAVPAGRSAEVVYTDDEDDDYQEELESDSAYLLLGVGPANVSGQAIGYE